MDPDNVFCHNPNCPASGKLGLKNIGVHSLKKRRYICHICGKTFTDTKGTVYYRLKHSTEFVTQIITLLAFGCPITAIVAAFGLDERTVADWQSRAGIHCQKVHQHLVQQPRDLGQVQADEIRVKHQGGIAWLAMAIAVSTRLWLGGVVSPGRDTNLITSLIEQVRSCALYPSLHWDPLLFCVDGLITYVSAIQKVLAIPVLSGKRGRPCLKSWENLCIVRVIKRVSGKRVVGITQRLACGTWKQVCLMIKQTQNTLNPHVCYIERINATFRSRITALVRRGRSLVHHLSTLRNGMYLVGTAYNFCTPHKSLRKKLYLSANRHRWIPMTPAMAIDITDHVWTVHELLFYQVPLPPWKLPRGRLSKRMKELINQWNL
jgi:transposase-like protein